jgi:hypothetical protein
MEIRPPVRITRVSVISQICKKRAYFAVCFQEPSRGFDRDDD